ncbi:MAG: hypothetical protein Q7T19_12420 [Caulobacter sp.]|nr:hypothetical protein [Caulobacter sp.]
MTNTNARPWLAGLLGLLLALGLAASPLSAHEDDKAPVPAASPATAPATAAMSPEDMPVTDMAWPTDDDDGMMMSHKARPTTFEGRLLAWIGMWHPAAIHFPIALLLTVAFLEGLAAVRRKPIYTASNRILLAVGVAGAFVAAPMGWLNAGLPTPDDSFALTVHRWLGTAMPFLLLALWSLKRPAEQAATRLSSRGYEALLAATVLLILVQAYFGAIITHGAEHMMF